MPKPPRGTPIRAGGLYGVDDAGRLHQIPDTAGPPSFWICRRVADYAAGPPAGAAIDVCTQCGAAIAYNPARAVTAPRVCMQCAGIQPDPA